MSIRSAYVEQEYVTNCHIILINPLVLLQGI